EGLRRCCADGVMFALSPPRLGVLLHGPLCFAGFLPGPYLESSNMHPKGLRATVRDESFLRPSQYKRIIFKQASSACAKCPFIRRRGLAWREVLNHDIPP